MNQKSIKNFKENISKGMNSSFRKKNTSGQYT